ncbi:putative phosphatidylglycerol phosphatidylinositol transfer protein [Lyophyllum shimeji]|uniref:Phosphatidylglycerol/phosphatidylinositol transfer protein n=1 Tax=Lyophyllum shimeji TaxID=47721 RepID=A0A9P3PIU4_LYOSH|nr:putative phosphatidylglycerol phosphatidylinositol transfer protein [Lyophyllum shimeji]
MVRFSLVAVLALSSAALGLANPVEYQVSLQEDDTVHTNDKWDYVNCGNPSDPIQVEKITVFPDPPQPGKDLTVTVKGTATEVIEEGAYADVEVKLGLVKLLRKRFDVCEEARNANASVQCPVKPDSYTVVQTVALPREIPRAKFTVNVRGYTVDDGPMLCLDLHVDFMKKPFLKFGW